MLEAFASPKLPVGPSRRFRFRDRSSGQEDQLVFRENHAFNSPSAAGVVLGRSSNGWREWTDAESRTLDELERQ